MGESWQCGKSLFLLLLLSVLLRAATARSLQYVVVVPSVINLETSENFCIQINNLKGTLNLTLLLEPRIQNLILNRVTVKEEEVFQCFPFKIPRLSNIFPPSKTHLELRGYGIHSRKEVQIERPKHLLFIQTDKPLYRARQQVQFRIVSMDKDLHPLKKKLPFVYIQDPQNNRVFQWRDVEIPLGITQLSYSLSSDPLLGTYKVVVEEDSQKIAEYNFEVDEYVQPKFELWVKAPKRIAILTKEIEVSVCGRYAYRKPVLGLIKLSLCRYPEDLPSDYTHETLCKEFESKADGDGCLSRVVNMKEFHLNWRGFLMAIKVEGKITEEETGVELNATESIEITPVSGKLTLEDPDRYYKPGIPYVVQVKLIDLSEVPISNETVEIMLWATHQRLSQVTDAEGRAEFSINTTNIRSEVLTFTALYQYKPVQVSKHWVTPRYSSAFHTAYLLYSPSKSYIHIDHASETFSCGHHEPVRVRYILNRGGEEEDEIVFYYMVKAKGHIIRNGIHRQPVEQGRETKGDFLLNLSVDVDTAPKIYLLLYTILPNGELVAGSRNFTVEKCFSNKARLWFSDQEGLPGQKTQLHLSASPGSLCAIHAVDQGVFLLKSEDELSPEKVYSFLPKKDYVFSFDFFRGQSNLFPCPTGEPTKGERIGTPVHFIPEDGDTYNVFRDFGVNIFTNTRLHIPRHCSDIVMELKSHDVQASRDTLPDAILTPLTRDSEPASEFLHVTLPEPLTLEDISERRPRSVFSETWLWDLVVINGSQGNSHSQHHRSTKKRDVSEEPKEIAVPVTIPDAITEWKAGAFCLSTDTGFGLAQSTTLRTFQPFFTELTLPYAVVRGEAFPLKATVSSYLPYCIRVRISLTPSDDFEAFSIEKAEDSYCICANGRKSVSWVVAPKILGEINLTASAEAVTSDQLCGNEAVEVPTTGNKDVVTKSLLVEPEGIEKEVVFNSILCAPGEPVSKTFPLTLPEDVVEGSARASFCVLEDVLGRAIENLHQLLKIPHGSGEQNIAHFAPNLYILNYLNQTGQLTGDIKSKAIEYLEEGYEWQLRFKHADGSYSAFRIREGSTWLTAFVLKSFARARSIIFIEDKHINDAQRLLTQRQESNGCFQNIGSLIHSHLKDEINDQTALSAYVIIALLEVPLPPTDPVVENGLGCLEKATEAKEIHVYLRALLAYAFALAGKEEKRQEMLDSLLKVAVKDEDGSIHWDWPWESQESSAFRRSLRARADDVEVTSYVLLALLTKEPLPSPEELATASAIVKWLAKEQNSYGGYASTQDTVVALQALSQYRMLTYSKDSIYARATLSSGDAVLAEFHVDSNNSLLLQCQDLPQVPGDYKVEVTGCIFIQIALKYNVPLKQEDAPFRLDVHSIPETCVENKGHVTFDVAVNVSYTGRQVSSTAILQIKMLSGYIPVKSSVKKLEKQGHVQKSEVTINHVVLYLDEVRNPVQTFSFTVEQETPVRGLKPALVKVYDYYETDEFATAEYTAPCSTDDIKEVSKA